LILAAGGFDALSATSVRSAGIYKIDLANA